jgi:hypothetical protein
MISILRSADSVGNSGGRFSAWEEVFLRGDFAWGLPLGALLFEGGLDLPAIAMQVIVSCMNFYIHFCQNKAKRQVGKRPSHYSVEHLFHYSIGGNCGFRLKSDKHDGLMTIVTTRWIAQML